MLKVVEVLGSIMCKEFESEDDKDGPMAELGMLAVHQRYLRWGIGGNLIATAEKHALEDLDCKTMRLEILSPRDFEHPMKKMLKEWYVGKLNYVEGKQEDFGAHYPELKEKLKCDCVFTVYTKKLGE